MRLSSTLKHYLQESVATATLRSPPPDDRHTLFAASKSFDVSQLRVAPKTYAAGSSALHSVAASAASDYAKGNRQTLPPAREMVDFA